MQALFIFFVSLVVTVQGDSRSEGPPYTTCDASCEHQVKILEGFIAFLILGFSLGVGLCCMKSIDTPSMFASPQNAKRSHQE